jgi:hypothetical protein
MGAAFGLQSLAGFIIALWPASEGRYPAEAHQAALAIGLALQLAALAWFAAPRQRPILSIERAVGRAALLMQPHPARASPQYAVPVTARSVHLAAAQRQAVRWRRIAAASASVCVAVTTIFTLQVARGGGHRQVAEAAAGTAAGAERSLARAMRVQFSLSGASETGVANP